MYSRMRRRLGDMLIEEGLINYAQLQEALRAQRETGKRLGEVLVEQELVTSEQIIRLLQEQLGVDHIILPQYDIDVEATKKISENLAKRHELIPIKIKNNKLIVAMSDPLNIFAIDDVKIYTGMEVQPVISNPIEIRRAIEIYYGKQEAMKAAEEYKKEFGIEDDEEKLEDMDTEDAVNSAPIVKLVNTILEQAIRMKVSDIHIEPFQKYIRIRYRRDGQLEEMMRHSLQLLPAMITRIKIIGGMNIAEKRRPQDGRATIELDEQSYDLRVSILPTIYGEKAVIRINDRSTFLKSIEELGLLSEDKEKFYNMLKNPHGIILVTGPTGSGKTTTLYSMMRQLNKENTNIVTVEDPVEAAIDGINQVQVNPKAGLDFATVLRSLLRQDFNIVMVGEIRDGETAEIAVRAAVTGHLVLSTLHTNDAPSAITRLLDMNIEPFLIGTSLVGVVSQRLVRLICPKCNEEYMPLQSELDILGVSENKSIILHRGRGCNFCNNSGYRERTGIYEIMPVSNSLRQLINRGADADLIRKQAISEGMYTIKERCADLVLEGMTTVEELVRVAYSLG